MTDFFTAVFYCLSGSVIAGINYICVKSSLPVVKVTPTDGMGL